MPEKMCTFISYDCANGGRLEHQGMEMAASPSEPWDPTRNDKNLRVDRQLAWDRHGVRHVRARKRGYIRHPCVHLTPFLVDKPGPRESPRPVLAPYSKAARNHCSMQGDRAITL